MSKIAANCGWSKSTIFNCFKEATTVQRPDDLTKDHVLILHGGGDISPSFYGQKKSKRGHGFDDPTDRDIQEWIMIERAVKMGVPIVGICRGAQMLCAFDGGTLCQHIEGHGGSDHAILDTRDDKIYRANTCHHQMMVMKDGHKNLILAHTIEEAKGYDENDKQFTIFNVPEVVYFPKLKAIGIQGHPEWMPGSPFTNYCSNLIKEFLLNGE